MSKNKGRKPQPQPKKLPRNMKDSAPQKNGGVYLW
ncbi:phage-related capsid packaging protein [Klebsiella pneumoniae]|nr:phage-related capsid packaging protein [Klebsiella pneumoniae]